MPRITPYVAPVGNLSESTRGDAAWEQAGRRLGPLYNEAAQFQRQEGALTAQGIKQKIWPYDIARLLETQGHTGGGGRLRGGNTSTLADRGTSTGRIGLPDNGGAVNQIMYGAGALGRALGDGGYQLATAKEPEDMTLEGGRLITSSQSRKLSDLYNTDLDKSMSEYANKIINTQDYWRKYNANSQTSVDPTLGSLHGPDYPMYNSLPPAPAAPDTSSSGGLWSGLSNALSGPGDQTTTGY